MAAWYSSVWLRNCSHFQSAEGWVLPQIILCPILILEGVAPVSNFCAWLVQTHSWRRALGQGGLNSGSEGLRQQGTGCGPPSCFSNGSRVQSWGCPWSWSSLVSLGRDGSAELGCVLSTVLGSGRLCGVVWSAPLGGGALMWTHASSGFDHPRGLHFWWGYRYRSDEGKTGL